MVEEYSPILCAEESTVMAKYERTSARSDAYQTEARLEEEFIRILSDQGYDYISIKDCDGLIANLRSELELLNRFTFTDAEWSRFVQEEIAKPNEGIVEKTAKIQEDPIRAFRRDDGTVANVKLFDRQTIHNNHLQIINQYAETGGVHPNRYDVTILVNGLPLVHVELKKRGGSLKEAFNQIERYQYESFWANLGLYEFVQIFVISNGTYTKYYSNTTRHAAIKERSGKANAPKKRVSATFEFTSYWADQSNEPITDLVDFSKTFFARHTLLNILAKYCVFTEDRTLLVMRPYQIAATEKIITRIRTASSQRRWKGVDAGGYIWHTTGSGKTLTSFKTAQLATQLEGIDKVLFIVDRKDLDYQTMKEYDRFQKDAANSNRSAAILQRQLEDRDERGRPKHYKIIITTIQKLQIFVRKFAKSGHPVFDKHVVLIFDECHRSQFGDMHSDIACAFKKKHMFGFTGTPIFAKNAPTSSSSKLHTTEEAFGEKLHAYTIVDAIRDRNVLPFRVDYVSTMRTKDEFDEEKLVEGIEKQKALEKDVRIANVVSYIIEHFEQKTKRRDAYTYNTLLNISDVASSKREIAQKKEPLRLMGFNSMFAVFSIKAAKLYYAEFKRQLGERFGKSFRVATIFSYAANEDKPDEAQGSLDEENSDDTSGLDQYSRDFLEEAIADYNETFSTSYDTSVDKFPNYYKDLSLRMKNRQVDLTIVVNMFLTGFDAPTLNTLWVDKHLRMHGLLQAFSRTNRILNSVKTFGNIVCFQGLQKEVDESLALFGDREARGVVLMRSFKDYYYGYEDENGDHVKGYVERVEEFQEKFPIGEPPFGESAEHQFVEEFGAILRLRNILTSFDEFSDPVAPIDMQDYTGTYNDLHDKYRKNKEKEDIVDDLVFEMELVRQVEVNIDYILALVAKYKDENCKDTAILDEIDKAINSSPDLRPKGALIHQFIATVSPNTDVVGDWETFVVERREEDFRRLVAEERLNEEGARKLIENYIENGEVETGGTEIDRILPSVSRFGKNKDGETRKEKKTRVIEKLKEFVAKYLGL